MTVTAINVSCSFCSALLQSCPQPCKVLPPAPCVGALGGLAALEWGGCSGSVHSGLILFPTGPLGGTDDPSSLPLGSEVPSSCCSSRPARKGDVGAAQAEQERVEAQTFAVLPLFSLVGIATTSRSSLYGHNWPFPASRANTRRFCSPRGRG